MAVTVEAEPSWVLMSMHGVMSLGEVRDAVVEVQAQLSAARNAILVDTLTAA